ncbi:hypothetical protein IA69_11845 [Massilia sp. JS1662]|nr:hypothetical protein [Massilia sp. JS1662]KGF81635.1 hypothetical protein IA69_11845 [Massilia sp. JS1662]
MLYDLGKYALIALCLFCAPTANAQQAVTIQGQKHPSAWFKAESPHVVVYADTTRDSARLILQNIERLDDLLRLYTKPFFKSAPNEPKLTFYYRQRKGDLRQHADTVAKGAVGLYTSCSAGVHGVGVEIGPMPDSETQTYLFEAYARHFLYHHTDIRAPLSFIDGFAQYFAAARFADDQMVVGQAPAAVALYLDFLRSGRRYSLTYADVLSDNDSEGHGYAGPAGIKLEFAARAWVLTHFMLSSEANRTRMARYLNLANGGTSAPKAFETAFGMKPDELDEVLWRYRLREAKALRIEAPALSVAPIDVMVLPESVSDYVMMDATLKSCPGRATGEALLRLMTANPGGTPNHPLARMALSRAQVDWGNPQDAIPYLSTQRTPEALELLGRAHLRLAEGQQGAQRTATLETARRRLVDALNAAPSSATAAYALLRAELATGEPPTTTALTAARLAWENGREVGEYARSAALMFAYAGDHARSHEAFNVLIRNRRDPALAAWAADWNGRMVTGTDGAAVLAELRRAPASDAAFREWTVAGNATMENVVRAAGLADLRDYLDGQKNRGGSSAATQQQYQLQQQIEALATDRWIDVP